jgi:3-oxoacyl-[acyl-carrier protein] reductase
MSIAIDLSGRVAWVTGGASGIGAAIVETLAAAGARVVSCDRAYQGTEDGGPIVRVGLDLRDAAAIQAAAAELGGRGLAADILVNNAGIAKDAVVWRMTDADWSEVIDVNLGGTFRMTRACAPEMRRRRSGAIVNIVSINALRGKFGQANYAASKGGIVSLTKSVARELARDRIRVNAVAPGFVKTPLTATLPPDVLAQADREAILGRIGDPADIANAVLFLVSPLAAHITGQVVVVDGGQMI